MVYLRVYPRVYYAQTVYTPGCTMLRRCIPRVYLRWYIPRCT